MSRGTELLQESITPSMLIRGNNVTTAEIVEFEESLIEIDSQLHFDMVREYHSGEI